MDKITIENKQLEYNNEEALKETIMQKDFDSFKKLRNENKALLKKIVHGIKKID